MDYHDIIEGAFVIVATWFGFKLQAKRDNDKERDLKIERLEQAIADHALEDARTFVTKADHAFEINKVDATIRAGFAEMRQDIKDLRSELTVTNKT